MAEKTHEGVHIWVDADACPKAIKEILFRAAERRRVPTYFVANHFLRVPRSPFIHAIKVGSGADVADSYIVQHLNEERDIVITGDIPLASLVVERHCVALSPRGSVYTEENVRERLSVRNFAEELRGEGIMTGGPQAFGEREKRLFSNAFDRLLTQKLQRFSTR